MLVRNIRYILHQVQVPEWKKKYPGARLIALFVSKFALIDKVVHNMAGLVDIHFVYVLTGLKENHLSMVWGDAIDGRIASNGRSWIRAGNVADARLINIIVDLVLTVLKLDVFKLTQQPVSAARYVKLQHTMISGGYTNSLRHRRKYVEAILI